MHALFAAPRRIGGRGTLRAAVTLAALALSGSAAFAGEGQGGPFDITGGSTTTYSTVGAAANTGSETYPTFAGGVNVAVLPGRLLPAGTDMSPDVANSLPPNFMTGTAAWVQANTLDRWFAAQRDNAARMLARSRAMQPKG